MSVPFRHTRRIEFRDTDAAGIAHFSVFFNYMEEAECALWRALGTSVKQSDGDDFISWPRVNAACDYLSPVRFEDKLEICISVERLGEKSVTFVYAFSSGSEDRPVARGRITAVCCRFPPGESPESISIPPRLREQLATLQV